MKEISLNILDITENSVKAGSTLTEILLTENEHTLTVIIKDNGCGMTEEVLSAVENPFYTTRRTRSVGLGIPLFKMSAEQTGGSFRIDSKDRAAYPLDHGTTVTAIFNKGHIDHTPLGDIVSTVQTLVQGHPEVDFVFIHEINQGRVEIDTREMREVLEGIPLNSFEIISWIGDNLREQYSSLY